MDKRHQRMLEEVLTLPGNEVCADCRSMSPRWASVNLGIFLCVGCASVHRKLGTHKSRVKSVTLDSWTREQITQMRQIGNKASNAVYNPNESLHPAPPNSGAEDRDSEIEKFIRRKYEQGAFKAGAGGQRMPAPTSLNRAREAAERMPAPTSLNRAREAAERMPGGLTSERTGGSLNGNRRNPELNDVLVPKQSNMDRELPALPITTSGATPRPRPTKTGSSTGAPSFSDKTFHTIQTPVKPAQTAPPFNSGGALFNTDGAVSSTLPLQMTGYGGQQQQYPSSSLAIPGPSQTYGGGMNGMGTPFSNFNGSSPMNVYGGNAMSISAPSTPFGSSYQSQSGPSSYHSTHAALSSFDPLSQRVQGQFAPGQANGFQQPQQQFSTVQSNGYPAQQYSQFQQSNPFQNGNMNGSQGMGTGAGMPQQNSQQQYQQFQTQQQQQQSNWNTMMMTGGYGNPGMMR